LKNGADVNEVPHAVPETPLQVAADTVNSLEMLHLLLENGADPNMAMEESTPACEYISPEFHPYHID
jgi:ankyrin repeat protein